MRASITRNALFDRSEGLTRRPGCHPDRVKRLTHSGLASDRDASGSTAGDYGGLACERALPYLRLTNPNSGSIRAACHRLGVR
jgi:hypothetical protein